MPILHRREQLNNIKPPFPVATDISLPGLPTQKRRGLKRWRKWVGVAFWAVVLLVAPVVYHYLLDEYAWVHIRCLKTWFRSADTFTEIECVEAATHERASRDQSLWDLQASKYLDFNATEAVSSVHYTITAPLRGDILDLVLCSMEASARMCQDVCVLNVWIVDKANDYTLHNSTWFREMRSSLESYRHCFRIFSTHMPYEDILTGNMCIEPKPCAIARSLRQWLSSPLAHNQLPAHVSDAWRLVALHEFGGLYLDADVLPISSNILHLPHTAVPAQDKVGAYRLNGGTLRMRSRASCNDNIVAPASFLDFMVRDHLDWAPRLALMPQKSQTFGFLGPCALTRVYTRHEFTDSVTILAHELVEPAVSGETICQGALRPLAIHFSGKKKRTWKKIMLEARSIANNCLKNVVGSACPRRLQMMERKVRL